MRGVYTIKDVLTTVTTAKQLLYLATPATCVIEILSAGITSTDEVTNEQIYAKLARATGTVGGGDALTPKPTEELSAASVCTAKGGNTAITGMTPDGDDDAIAIGAGNKLVGWEYVPAFEERDIVKPSDFLILETKATLTSCTLTAYIKYREIG